MDMNPMEVFTYEITWMVVAKVRLLFFLSCEVESERLFENIWAMLVYEIKKLEEVDGEKPLGVEIFNDTPKTKKEVLSLDINWAVFDQCLLVVEDAMEDALKLVKIFGTAFPISISGANPNTELLSMEGMPTDNNLHQADSVWNGEESSNRVGGVIKRNRYYSYPVVDFETLRETNWLGSVIPWNIEKLPS
ncbi:hypothetical protein C5167_000885 [Papaver somniferum]|uniref:Uncharacterized protein n=1 Tax=Papaver somniferum TaxID=3469 RepID=A0A4Y7KVA8_PAPSO|nr:hypothetical protein C5167_000885 [Papaver somniferum]